MLNLSRYIQNRLIIFLTSFMKSKMTFFRYGKRDFIIAPHTPFIFTCISLFGSGWNQGQGQDALISPA